ncbi:MAG: macro domain-containing protein, partial [Promethearchaeota archaeon]
AATPHPPLRPPPPAPTTPPPPPASQQECNKLAPIKTGEAVITTGGNLKAKYVIHTAGPIYSQYSPEKADMLLSNSVKNSLKIFEEKGLKYIAFPSISAGIYGFPIDRCAEIMISTIMEHMKDNSKKQGAGNEKGSGGAEKTIILCLYGSSAYNLFVKVFKKLIK